MSAGDLHAVVRDWQGERIVVFGPAGRGRRAPGGAAGGQHEADKLDRIRRCAAAPQPSSSTAAALLSR